MKQVKWAGGLINGVCFLELDFFGQLTRPVSRAPRGWPRTSVSARDDERKAGRRPTSATDCSSCPPRGRRNQGAARALLSRRRPRAMACAQASFARAVCAQASPASSRVPACARARAKDCHRRGGRCAGINDSCSQRFLQEAARARILWAAWVVARAPRAHCLWSGAG